MNEQPTEPNEDADPPRSYGCTLSEDLLRGAEAIAEFLFGDPHKRRQIYHLAQHSKLPVFKLGSNLCARKSRLIEWIEQQENKATSS